MAEKAEVRHTLSEQQARQLANVTKTVPMMETITPRWLVTFLSWVPVEAGTYRVNKVKPTHPGTRTIECSPDEEIDLPEIYVDYAEKPREYTLNAVTTVLDVQTRISDLYRSPHDQIREQLRLMIEKVKERQENELVNNTEYGLLHNVAPEFHVKTRKGAPTPDDLDELLSRVWKEPNFFLAHPRAIAAFPDLARNPAGAFRQTCDQGRKVEHTFGAYGRKKAGCDWIVPAWPAWRSHAQSFGSLHGN
jgi:Arc/MetJ-type ribon-helix-helix transcriptional regulator